MKFAMSQLQCLICLAARCFSATPPTHILVLDYFDELSKQRIPLFLSCIFKIALPNVISFKCAWMRSILRALLIYKVQKPIGGYVKAIC